MITSQQTSISLFKLFSLFFRLGCTSFGGPIAHIGFFHHEFVTKRKWYAEDDYLQLVALCQFLPGPASSQVGMAIGLNARGYAGSLVSFLGFTLPSALLMMAFAFLIDEYEGLSDSSVLYSLKIVAVGVVAHAIWSMGKNQCRDTVKILITLASTFLALTSDNPFSQLLIIISAGIAGYLFCTANPGRITSASNKPYSKKFSIAFLTLFFLLLIVTPFVNENSSNDLFAIFDSFYRSGALVFGGGHVVLPLLENELVSTGLINSERFLYGYSAAQAVPGPLFTFSSYLGVIIANNSSPVMGSLLATFAIFLPGYLLLVGLLPYWQTVCKNEKLNNAINGINASVVGLLVASFINPIWLETIHTPFDILMALLVLIGLTILKLPPLKVIALAVISVLLFDLVLAF